MSIEKLVIRLKQRSLNLAARSAWTMLLVLLFADPASAQITQEELDHDRRFNSVAWMQNSAEYKLLTQPIFQLALVQLERGLKDETWSADEVQAKSGNFHKKMPAIILDIDETVLNNSPFNARDIIDKKPFSQKTWQAWCKEEKSTSVPGSLEFVQAAQKLGVKIFYVTNRVDAVRDATVKNLKRLGYPANQELVLTRNDKAGRGGEKVSRRAMVAKEHRIVLLIGDSISDFCTGMGTRDQSERNSIAAKKSSLLGARWIMLPNPAYGSWERALPKGPAVFRTERE